MFGKNMPADDKLNMAEYLDKMEGCWMGKNIGGTLGTPYEGQREMHDVQFYPDSIQGKALPNDDLDLQLVWMKALEDVGVARINERVLGEYWLRSVFGPWNEYGVGKYNMRSGLVPPLSGACNNDRWRNSNGAWIRSEIWACIFPGSPDEAAAHAYYDACCDHSGDGINAELFTAALESAAFVESDVNKLIDIALRRIPKDSRVARSIKIVRDGFAAGKDYRDVRNEVVKDSEDLGWFQAPANVAFAVLGILYGKGDFGRTICIATNCADDTDCTAGTAGAVMGIILGRKNIPEKWTAPIGDDIVTGCICNFNSAVPKTVHDLTNRVKYLALEAALENPTLPQFTDGETFITPELKAVYEKDDLLAKRVWNRDPYTFMTELPFGELYCSYENGPYAEPGKPIRVTFSYRPFNNEHTISLELNLPDGWTASPSNAGTILGRCEMMNSFTMTLVPGTLHGAFTYIEGKVSAADRLYRIPVQFPFQNAPALEAVKADFHEPIFDLWNGDGARRNRK